MFRITGVPTCENVVLGFLIQKPQHGLILYLRANMAAVISSDSQKCYSSSFRILVLISRISKIKDLKYKNALRFTHFAFKDGSAERVG